MKRTIRKKINPSYSLHDSVIRSFDMNGRDLVMRTQNGLLKMGSPNRQVEGYVEFHEIDWGYCYIFLFDSTGNVGPFGGEKKYLLSFIEERKGLSFTIIDEAYGPNQTKLFGHLLTGGRYLECIVELYHEGDMVFVEEDN